MANYRKISGVNVKSYSADPDKTYPSAFEGQLYYNSSDGQFKFIGLGAGAWASGGNLNDGRYGIGSAQKATTTAGLVFGGNEGAGPTNYARSDKSEEYDGTSWSEGNELNTARGRIGGLGIQTAALGFGGYTSDPTKVDEVESYNGTSWTEVADLPENAVSRSGFGTSTAGIVCGGDTGSISAETDSWDGSSWTEVAELNTARNEASAAGATSTAGLFMGGTTPGASALVESWDGSSWTETGDLNTARSQLQGCGTQTDALVFGGGSSAITESWNGTSWTEVADMAAARGEFAGSGTATAALATAGNNPALLTTEIWSYSHAFKKVTTS